MLQKKQIYRFIRKTIELESKYYQKKLYYNSWVDEHLLDKLVMYLQ